MIRTHVLFSDDGKTLWTSAPRLQKARRNQCKNWWNDTWRDRLLAVAHWLAAGADCIRLDAGGVEPIRISSEPIEFDSAVSYFVPPEAADRAEGVQEDERPHQNDDEEQENDEDEFLEDADAVPDDDEPLP